MADDMFDDAGASSRGALEKSSERGLAPGLLVAGVLALLVAAWSVAGGPSVIGGAKLLGGLTIAVVALVGVVLILRPGLGERSARTGRGRKH